MFRFAQHDPGDAEELFRQFVHRERKTVLPYHTSAENTPRRPSLACSQRCL